MKTYEVEMIYTAQVTYSGMVVVEAENEEQAEELALKAAQQNACSGWDSAEDSGDFEVQTVEEAE